MVSFSCYSVDSPQRPAIVLPKLRGTTLYYPRSLALSNEKTDVAMGCPFYTADCPLNDKKKLSKAATDN